MAMGQQKARQGDLMVSWSEMPRSPGHVFYDRLQSVLIAGGFDGFAEAACQPYYAARMPEHLPHRLSRYAKPTRRLSLAQSINMTCQPNA